MSMSLETLIAQTLQKFGNEGEAWDSITNQHGLLYLFRKFGRKDGIGELTPNIASSYEEQGALVLAEGGKWVSEIVNLIKNPNVGFLTDETNTSRQAFDPAREAIFPWAVAYGNAPVSDIDVAKNRGNDVQIIKLVNSIKSATAASMIEVVGESMWNTSDPAMMQGIPLLISDDGETTGSSAVGGLDTATYINWKNQFINVVAPVSTITSEQLFLATSKLLRMCTVGVSRPDILVASEDLYAAYELMQIEKKMLLVDVTKGQTTQEGVIKPVFTKFDANVFILFDPGCPVNRVYAINTEWLKFNVLKEKNFSVEEAKRDPFAPITNYPMTFVGTFSLRNRKAQGVLVFPVPQTQQGG